MPDNLDGQALLDAVTTLRTSLWRSRPGRSLPKRLHRLDPEGYLRDLFRVLGHWPRDRYLELAPKFWAATRSRLDPGQLANEVGPLTVPPPLNTTASAEQ